MPPARASKKAAGKSAASVANAPAALDAPRLRALADDPAMARARGFLDRLAAAPPQVILLEGGDAPSRLAMALWWMARVHCRGPVAAPPPAAAQLGLGLPGLLPAPGPAPVSQPGSAPGDPSRAETPAPPCGVCPVCEQIFSSVHLDLFLFDGVAESIKIDDLREMLPHLAERPHDGVLRCIVLAEFQNTRAEAANLLLKSLEEPRPGNCFLLLTPQRERLLPTLVSRSLTLTLAWPDPHQPKREAPELKEKIDAWLDRLETLRHDGRGWFGASGVKGAIDKPLAQALVLECQRRLARVLRGQADPLFSRFEADALRRLDTVFAEAHASLEYGVTPPLVLDWLATRFFLCAHEDRAPAHVH